MSESADRTVISAQVPTPLRDELARLAGEHDRSLSAEMRRAIELHLHLAEFPERKTAAGDGLPLVRGQQLRSDADPVGRRAPDSSTASRQPAGDER